MADLERLVVSLDADITRLSRQLAKAGLNIENFSTKADSQAGKAKDAINKHLGGSAGASGGLNFTQFQELSAAARHSFDAIVAGASPLRVLATEGAKASSAIGTDGLGGLAKRLGVSLSGVITPARIAAGGVVGLGAAALYAYSSYEEAQLGIRNALSGVGAASHATGSDIEGISERVAAFSKISVSSARAITTALAATGKVDVGQLGGIANLAKGLGVLTGQSTEDAGKELAKIFSDPAKGAEELNAKLGVLDDSTLQYIRSLALSGDRQGANTALLRAAQPELLKAAQNVGVLTRAYDALKSAASRAVTDAGAGISKLVDGPSIEERLQKAQTSQRSFRLFADPEGDKAREAEIASLQAQLEARGKAEKADGNRKEANNLSIEAGGAVRQADPAFEQIRQLQEQKDLIGRALSSELANPGVNIEGGYTHALESYNSIDLKLKELQKDYAEGGRFAAQALRQADFAKATAGLSTYAKGLAQINFQYDQLIESARKDGNIRSLSALNRAKTDAVAGYNRDSLDKARAEVPVSGDLAKVIIGSEGNNAAKNPNSSASGIGQFIDSTFIDQFKKVFSETYAQIVSQNGGNQKAIDAAVLSRKKDNPTNEALIINYAKEIGEQLNRNGVNGNDIRNQYLGYHFGAGGAEALLKSDPNASAASVLGPQVTAANKGEVADRTAGQLIDLIYQRVAKNSGSGLAQKNATISEGAQAATYDKSASAAARLQSIQAQLDADRESGGELGRAFTTAQDLETASSDKLTPALASQRRAILDLADARAKATQTSLTSRFDTDQKNATDALGRTTEQQAVYQTAKQYGEPGSDAFTQASAGLERLQALQQVKAEGSSFTKGLAEDLIKGTTAGKALENQLSRIVSKLADSAIDSLFSSLFGSLLGGKGGSGGGAGGIGGLLSGILHLAGGGHVVGSGTGTSDSVPAMLSHGEYVVNAAATSKNAPLLAAINSGRVLRFAGGGPVGSMPSATKLSYGGNSNMVHMTVDARGAQGNSEIQAQISAGVAQGMAQVQKTIGRNVLTISKNAKMRY